MANTDDATMLNDDVWIHKDNKPFSFGHCVNIDRFGLIKVNHRNYEALKNSTNPQVYYNAAMGTLMIDTNLVMIDDKLADDIAMYQPNFTAKTAEEKTTNWPIFSPEALENRAIFAEEITLLKSKENSATPPIRPIEPIRLLAIAP